MCKVLLRKNCDKVQLIMILKNESEQITWSFMRIVLLKFSFLIMLVASLLNAIWNFLCLLRIQYQILGYIHSETFSDFDILILEISLTGVPVPCNTMWDYVQCSIWRSWMQMLNWFLEIRVHNPVLAMLHVVFLQFLKRLQVINTEIDLNRKVVFFLIHASWCVGFNFRDCAERSSHNSSRFSVPKWCNVNTSSGMVVLLLALCLR